jgi:lipoate-protein ligase A
MSAIQTSAWRLIVDAEPRSGAANMAIDQAIAEACAAGSALPTLRFYQWAPPAVSLGRHQHLTDIDCDRAAALGYDVVRRSTGGRAILHTDELTYSVAAPESEPRVAGGVIESYMRLSNALVLALHRLGVTHAQKAGGNVRAGPDVSAACFEVPSAYEIVVEGRKLMGSAQSRRAGYVLQHGSLPLVGDIARLVAVLSLEESARAALSAELSERACTLAGALSISEDAPALHFHGLAETFAGAFADELAIEFKPSLLSAGEVRRSAELIRTQFAAESWTAHR